MKRYIVRKCVHTKSLEKDSQKKYLKNSYGAASRVNICNSIFFFWVILHEHFYRKFTNYVSLNFIFIKSKNTPFVDFRWKLRHISSFTFITNREIQRKKFRGSGLPYLIWNFDSTIANIYHVNRLVIYKSNEN